ncbi:MAG: serine/threonine protein kinase [Gemmatimonadales bacterium]|nr:serine/threonine protein kinase [Gemmatimonadota bacterium]MCL4215000.1 serine/threonine protein kinase [Gemmatimonadales bacterium]
MTDPLRTALESAVAGRYTVVRELGRGGMGAVYLANDLTLDRQVAIKVLPPELAVQPTLRERFVREAKLAASLSHPNIIHVHAVEEQGDLIAIVMHYVDGESLSERVARAGPFSPADCARLMQDVAWALGYAHGRGIVHRDVKPDNLMIERGTGRVQIMDFGIARQERASSLTEVGQSIGTPHYMSPEQAAAETVDGRSDLYSLGCVGFYAATGRTPFEAESAHKLLMQHLTAPAPAVETLRPEFPRGLSEVIAKALAKDPADRFATGEAMAEAIGALQLRAREVAPLLRLFYQQTAQSIQVILILVLVLSVFAGFVPRTDIAIYLLMYVLFGTVGLTIVTQSLERVRFVIRQGYTAPDVHAAITAMEEETATAREQLLGDPVERRRIARRKRVAVTGGFLGGLSIPWAISRVEDSSEAILPGGVLILVVAAALIGVSIAFWAMRPVRVSASQRLASRLWRSRLGAAIFARAQRRYARGAGRPVVPAGDSRA